MYLVLLNEIVDAWADDNEMLAYSNLPISIHHPPSATPSPPSPLLICGTHLGRQRRRCVGVATRANAVQLAPPISLALPVALHEFLHVWIELMDIHRF